MNLWLAIPTFLATLSWVAVVILYWRRAKWWRSWVGINTMGISFFIALALARLTYSHLDGIPPAPVTPLNLAFGVLVYTGLMAFGVQRFILIEQSQRQKALSLLSGRPNRRWDDPK